MKSDLINALGVGIFGVAAYQDGALWQSGLFIGIAGSAFYHLLMQYLRERNDHINPDRS